MTQPPLSHPIATAGPSRDAQTSDRAAPLTGRRLLVLGAAGEVGEGIVQSLLRHGGTVLAVSRSADRLALLRRRLTAVLPPVDDERGAADASSGWDGDWTTRFVPLVGDVGEATEGRGATSLEEAVRAAGPLDGVVASLGGWRQGPALVATAPADWDETLAQSLTAHFHAARRFLPAVRQRPGGSYTLVNGGGAQHPVPGAGAICISAAAQLMLKDVLAVEHRADPVRINTLLLATPVRTRSRPTGAPDWLTAADAGAWAAYLATPDAPHRGETLVLDAPARTRELPAPFGSRSEDDTHA